MKKKLVIAIDGTAASGKGTLARHLAKELGYRYLDTGRLYRAVGWKVMQEEKDPSDVQAATEAAKNLSAEDIKGHKLRHEDVARAASIVSAIPEVRAALLKYQRDFAAGGAAILDGRDIGTVVCPDADLKLFVTASLEARAKRRFLELQERGESPSYDALLAGLKERDARDSKRTIAPLTPAKDAVIIDTSSMSADEVFSQILKLLKN